MFDVESVVLKANEALVKNKKNPEESRQIYLEEIMDWSENYSENYRSNAQSNEAKRALASIVELWIAFCNMEIGLNQFKRALQIYEDALNDPVVRTSPDIYLSYGAYCRSRGRNANAQKAYIRGLSADLSNDDSDQIWVELLSLIRNVGNSETTIDDLYKAVLSESGSVTITPPGPSFRRLEELAKVKIEEKSFEPKAVADATTQPPYISNSTHEPTSDHVHDSYATAESKTEDASNHSIPPVVTNACEPLALATANELDKMEIVDTSEGLKDRSSSSAVLNIDSLLEEVRRDGDLKGTISEDIALIAAVDSAMLGAAERKEKPPLGSDDLDSVTGMTPEQLLRMHHKRSSLLFTAPNQEPTCLGLRALNEEDQKELTEYFDLTLTELEDIALQPSPPRAGGCAGRCLDIVEALWTAQALKEKQFEAWFVELKKLHDAEHKRLLGEFEKRGKDPANVADAKLKNQMDLKRFQTRCTVHVEVVAAIVNKTLTSMLLEQLRLLTEISFPRVSDSLIDSIEASLETRKVGNATASAELESSINERISAVRVLLCALLSLRVNVYATDDTRAIQGVSLARSMSMGEEEYHADFDGDRRHRRAKRRRLYPGQGEGFEGDAMSPRYHTFPPHRRFPPRDNFDARQGPGPMGRGRSSGYPEFGRQGGRPPYDEGRRFTGRGPRTEPDNFGRDMSLQGVRR